VRGVFQPKSESAPGADKGGDKDGGATPKDAAATNAKSAPKDTASANATAPRAPALQPAPDLASPAAK
jgi:hypothetical protein